MSTRCTICSHPARGEIEAALGRGLSTRRVAGRFSVSRSSLDRHVNNGHVTAERGGLVLHGDVEVIRDIPTHSDPLAQLQALRAATLDTMNMHRRRGDEPLALASGKELRALLQLEIEVAERQTLRRDDTAPEVQAAREKVDAAIREQNRKVLAAAALLDRMPAAAAKLRETVARIEARREREAAGPVLELAPAPEALSRLDTAGQEAAE